MFVSKLAAVLLLLCAASCVKSTQITISPNCTQEDVECYGLSMLYANNPEGHEASLNTTIVFQSGVHSMTSDIVIRDVDNLTLQFEEGSRIHCTERAKLVFMNITNLQIFGMMLNNCGAEINESLAEEALSVQTQTVLKIKQGLQAAIFAVNVQQFQMDHVVINGSHGYGFLGINIIGESSVANTLINSSNTNSLTDYCMIPRLTPAQAAKCLGGNALFVYNDFPACPDNDLFYTLSVFNSTFSHGLDPIGGFQNYISRGCGFGVIMSQKFYNVAVYLVNSTFTTNTARSYGSNLYIRLIIAETNSSVEIHRCRIVYMDEKATTIQSSVHLMLRLFSCMVSMKLHSETTKIALTFKMMQLTHAYPKRTSLADRSFLLKTANFTATLAVQYFRSHSQVYSTFVTLIQF